MTPATMSGNQAVPPQRSFRISNGTVPPEALQWTDIREKGLKRCMWRLAVFRTFGNQARTMRLAWVIFDLAFSKGYAFATDSALAREAKMPISKVQAALKVLELSGAILRLHVPDGSQFQRRIYLTRGVIDSASDTPQNGGQPLPPQNGG